MISTAVFYLSKKFEDFLVVQHSKLWCLDHGGLMLNICSTFSVCSANLYPQESANLYPQESNYPNGLSAAGQQSVVTVQEGKGWLCSSILHSNAHSLILSHVEHWVSWPSPVLCAGPLKWERVVIKQGYAPFYMQGVVFYTRE